MVIKMKGIRCVSGMTRRIVLMFSTVILYCVLASSVGAGASDNTQKAVPVEPPIPNVKIGAILPLSGELAKYGQTSRAAIQLAVEELNTRIKDKKVNYEVIFANDKMQIKEGLSEAKKLIGTDRVAVLIGPLASSITKAVAPIANINKVVLLSPGSSAPGIGDIGPFIFRNAVSDSYEGEEMARFVYSELGLRKLAIYHIYNDFGNGLSQVFKETFEALGGSVVMVESFQEKTRDHKTVLSKINVANPQAIYVVGYDEMVAIFRQARELRMETPWLASSFLNDAYLVRQMKNDADGTIMSGWAYNPKSEDERIRRFVSSVKERTNGLEPDVFSANAYDAIYLIDRAISLIGGYSPDEIRQGLLRVDDFVGVTGINRFEGNGDVKKGIVFKMVRDGNLVPYAK